jgi:hypothetical protein
MGTRGLLGLGAVLWAAAFAGVVSLPGRSAVAESLQPNMLAFSNDSGQLRTFDVNGAVDLGNPFFQDLGTNGRSCVTCHQAESAWALSADNARARFAASNGLDPLFSNNDGSNCEGAPASTTDERRAAYSLLLARGLIRVGLDVPPNAEFAIDSVEDPNGCGPAGNDVSLYRRPLPATNLRFLSAVMWDGRESSDTTTIAADLRKQANDATRGHAAAVRDLTSSEATQIVDFEMGLYSAQGRDTRAGNLNAQLATGGPINLSNEPFFAGINDPVGLNPSGAPFSPKAFTLFTPWETIDSARNDSFTEARNAIARGEQIFNTKPITITGVGGFNGQTFSNGVTVPDSIIGTCTFCHDTPDVGNHSVRAALNIGLSEPDVAPYLPVYTLRNLSTSVTVRTTDPGRAMITGKWNDIGRFKGPILRGLSSRAPYFHNGSAQTLDAVLDFYEKRFQIGLTPQERADLLAFLRAL